MVALAPNTSETSPWDVLDTFPKLHSRAREAKTPRCTEVPACKSLDRIEIWQAIYESCDGLEFFTRDPIGYVEGLNQYKNYMELVALDPSGLQGWIPYVIRPNGGIVIPGQPREVYGLPDTRPLTPGEIQLLQSYFGNAINLQNVVIHNSPYWGPVLYGIGVGGNNSITPDNHIYFPPTNYKPDFSMASNGWKAHLIHEMTHVLQHQQGQKNGSAFVELLVAFNFDYQPSYTVDKNALGRPLYEFNMEQQAAIMEALAIGYFTPKELPLVMQTISGMQTNACGHKRPIGPGFPKPYVPTSPRPELSGPLPDDFVDPYIEPIRIR